MSMTFAPKKCNTCGRVYNTPEEVLTTCTRPRVCSNEHLWINCRCNSTLFFKNVIGSNWFHVSFLLKSQDAKDFYRMIDAPEKLLVIDSGLFQEIDAIRALGGDFEAVAKIVAKRPMVASGIMVMAYNIKKARGMGQSVRTLSEAIAYLGVETMISFIISLAAKEGTSDVDGAADFWRKSQTTAELATTLGGLLGYTEPYLSELYLGASLLNIGKLLLAKIDLQKYTLVNQMTKGKIGGVPCHYRLAEITVGGLVPHEVLGEVVLSMWGLPSGILDIVGQHHKEPLHNHSAGRFVENYEVAACANQLSHWAFLEPHLINQGYLARILRRLGLTEADAEKIIDGRK